MNKKIKILIAEHDKNDLDLLAHELKNSGLIYESLIVQTETDFTAGLIQYAPDIILSDYTFPSFDGPAAYKIRERLAKDTPFIFVSGTVGEEVAVELIKSGVTDYALKDTLFTLPPKIIRALKEAEKKKEKTLTDEKLIKALHLSAFMGQINKNIIRIKNKELLFHNSCQIAVEYGKFKMAWIGMFDHKKKTISLVEHCNVPAEDLNFFIDTPYLSNGPQDHIIRDHPFYICNNVEHDPELEANKKLFALNHGINSLMILPIKTSGIIIGSLNLYSSELNFSGKEEIKLLIEVAKDISFALDAFEKEKKQVSTDQLLLRNVVRFKALIEKSADMKTLTNQEGKFIYCSPSVSTVFGYSPEEFLNVSAFSFFHSEDLSDLLKNRQLIIGVPGKSFLWRYRLKHKNGHWIWCEGTLTNLLHEPAIQAFVANFRDITEKKLTEEQQEFEKNNLNALINSTKDLMWSVDRDFNLITSNKPFDKMREIKFGKTLLKGENILFINSTPSGELRTKELYERAFAGEIFTEIEYYDSPFEFWTETSYYPIHNGSEIIGTACYSRDITDTKTTERQLQRSESFNKGVLNSLSSHIAVIDFNGNIIAVNEAWKRFAKENGETTLDRTSVGSNYFSTCEKAINSGDKIAKEALTGMKEIILNEDFDFYLEYPCHSPDKQRWFSMRAMKFKSDKPMIVVAHQNITERKLAEEKLIQSQGYLTEAQKLAKMGSWNYDVKSDKLTWSEELYTVFDTNKQNFIETHGSFLHLIDVEDRELAMQTSKHTQITGEPFALKYKITTSNGEKRVIQEYGYGEKGSSGKVGRLFGTAQDITERILAEIEKEKMIGDILQRSNNLEQFTYIISHNLRAPIANILGLANVLKGVVSDSDRSKIQEYLFIAVERLDETVKDLNKILQIRS
ncbi:MAG: hypothetical protein JWO32_2241, partial [Bacteroidetes bacterium]|nr:hypothetical protein [Bacteroidota bacterium]